MSEKKRRESPISFWFFASFALTSAWMYVLWLCLIELLEGLKAWFL